MAPIKPPKQSKYPISRRGFLGQAANAAMVLGFPVIVSAGTLGRGGLTPPSERVRLGLIGCGKIAVGLRNGFAGLPNVELAAFCDVESTRLVEYKNYCEALAAERLGKAHAADVDEIRLAILRALGHAGTMDQASAMQSLPAPIALALEAREHSLLSIAARLPEGQAVKVYRPLFETTRFGRVKEAAFRGWIQADSSQGLDLLNAALNGSDPFMLRVAIQATPLLEDPGVTDLLATKLSAAEPPFDSLILYALAVRKDPRVPQFLESALAHNNTRLAALEALAQAGTVRQVPAILPLLTDDDGALAKAAASALAKMPGPGIDEAMGASLRTADPRLQEALLKVFQDRQTPWLGAEALKYVESMHRPVASAALRMVVLCGTFEEFEGLCRLVMSAENNMPYRGALRAMSTRLANTSRTNQILAAIAAESKPPQKELFEGLPGELQE